MAILAGVYALVISLSTGFYNLYAHYERCEYRVGTE